MASGTAASSDSQSASGWNNLLPPPVAILGVPFDHVTLQQAVEWMDRMIVSGRPHYVVTANVDFLVQSLKDAELRRILLDAHMVLCDGTPLVWVSRWLGNPLPERVAGSDLVPLLLKAAAEKKYRVFLLGSTPERMEKAIENLRTKYPDLRIAGHFSPPFASLLEMEHEEILKRIKGAEADLLLVAFGCPKQEKWLFMYYRSLGVPVGIGVGASIDFLAGYTKRAPRWMRRCGLEWIYRLLQEPRRLFRRYVIDLFYFGAAIGWQVLRLKRISHRRVPGKTGPDVFEGLGWVMIRLPPRLDLAAVTEHSASWNQSALQERPCLVDASGVQFVDSTGVGLLVRLQKHCRQAQVPFLLVRPSEPLQRALRVMWMEGLFETVKDLDEGQDRVLKHHQQGGLPKVRVQPRPRSESSGATVRWIGEITSLNAERVWEETLSGVKSLARGDEVVVDLEEVPFLDSTGMSLMVKLKKWGKNRGVEVVFEKPGDRVRNVLQITRLESYLLRNIS